MRFIIFFLLALLSITANAQLDTTFTQAKPIGGLNRLALVYYDIEFTPDQRKLLENVDVELIFSISDAGVPSLESVNGVTNRALIDSIFAQTPELPRFIPEMRGGIPKQTLFFMQFQFPTYQANVQEFRVPSPFYQQKIEKDEFKVLDETGRGLEFVIHGIFTNHFGNADKYLKPGGGVHMGFEFVAANKLYYGFGFEMFGNKAAEKMIVTDSLPYSKAPFSATIGFYMGKWFDNFSVQAEVNYGSISVIPSDVENDIDGTSFQGFSPGIFVNYPIIPKNRRERVTIQGANAYINRFSFNLRGGFRGFIMDNTEANSIMIEVGVGIRFGSYFIKRYRLKDSYYLN